MANILTKSAYEAMRNKQIAALRNLERQRGPQRMSEYLHFCEWYAAPLDIRKEKFDDIKTMGEYAKEHGVHTDTLTKWKKRPEFYNLVSQARQGHADDSWGEVMYGWKKSVLKGNPYALELWLAYFMGWDKKLVIEEKHKLNLDMGDVRSLIEQLPEGKQADFYETIGRLLHEAQAAVTGEGDRSDAGAGQLQTQAHLPEPAD